MTVGRDSLHRSMQQTTIKATSESREDDGKSSRQPRGPSVDNEWWEPLGWTKPPDYRNTSFRRFKPSRSTIARTTTSRSHLSSSITTDYRGVTGSTARETTSSKTAGFHREEVATAAPTSAALTATLGVLGAVVVILVILIAYFGIIRKRRNRVSRAADAEHQTANGIANCAYDHGRFKDKKADRLSIIPECLEELEYEYGNPDKTPLPETVCGLNSAEYEYIDPASTLQIRISGVNNTRYQFADRDVTDLTQLSDIECQNSQHSTHSVIISQSVEYEHIDKADLTQNNNLEYEKLDLEENTVTISSDAEYEYVDPTQTCPTHLNNTDEDYLESVRSSITTPDSKEYEYVDPAQTCPTRLNNTDEDYLESVRSSITTQDSKEYEYVDPAQIHVTQLTQMDNMYQHMINSNLNQHLYAETSRKTEENTDYADGKKESIACPESEHSADEVDIQDSEQNPADGEIYQDIITR